MRKKVPYQLLHKANVNILKIRNIPKLGSTSPDGGMICKKERYF
jgi:hypothetical protein